MGREKFIGQSYQRRTKARHDTLAEVASDSKGNSSGSDGGSEHAQHGARKAIRKVPLSRSDGIHIHETAQIVNVCHGGTLPPRRGKGASRGKGKAVASSSRAQDEEMEEDMGARRKDCIVTLEASQSLP